MDRDAETLTLRPSKARWLVILSIALAFVAIGIFIPDDGSGVFWTVKVPCIGFFGLGAIVALVQFVPGLNGLTLAPDDFTIRALGRRHTISWREIVGEFRVVDLAGGSASVTPSMASGILRPTRHRMVGFDMTPPRGERRLAQWNKERFGVHGSLADTYGLGHQGLADLMNARLDRWRGAQPWAR